MSNSDLELRRLEITDGFAMPGFKGRYFMWPEEYWLLSKYLDLTRGDYLEIGSMCGIIAMSFAEKYPHRQFVCVDKFCSGHGTIAGEKEIFLQNLHEHNLSNVTLFEGDSLAVVPTLAPSFEMIFIDANHAYDYVLGDAINSWRVLLPGGFVAFHDYEYVEETTRAVQDFLKQTGARFLESSSSLAVVQKQGSPIRAGLYNYQRNQKSELLTQKHELLAQKHELLIERDRLLQQNAALKQLTDKLQDDIDWLLTSTKTQEEVSARITAEKREVEALLGAVQNSASWRLLNKWRKLRNWLAPENSLHRRLYDSVLRMVSGRS
jgi:precorrin-6B methylase 2